MLIWAMDGLNPMDKTNGTSKEPSCFFSMPTMFMLVLIWMGGMGFLMSQKRSAEMLVITTFTLSITGHSEPKRASGDLKLFISACNV